MTNIPPDNGDFIGRGFPFPLRFDARGSMVLVDGVEELERSMTVVLSTAPGERPFRPSFGCAIWELMFEPIGPNALGLMELYTREALAMWEPRVEITDVRAEPRPDDGAVDLHIDYVIRATNDPRNLVFPFYVIPADEDGPA